MSNITQKTLGFFCRFCRCFYFFTSDGKRSFYFFASGGKKTLGKFDIIATAGRRFLKMSQRGWGRIRQAGPGGKIIISLGLICLTARSLPYLAPIRAEDMAQNQQALEFSDRHGLPLGTILTRDREHTAVVTLNRISPDFINAIIAAEDKRYYQHGALDAIAIGRSLLEAIQAKQIVSGASTITMQLARMLEPTPRTIPNKLREIWLSWRLTAGTNKDQILEAYINRLPMGGNVYGVEAASRVYFGIPAADLNLARATILAAIPNDPTDLNPYYYWDALKKRQAYVLDRMIEDNYITRTQAERAFAEEISLLPRDRAIIAAPHFLFWLSEKLSGDTPKTKSSERQTQTYHIRTTIDRPLQQFVEVQVQQIVKNLAPYNVHHAAAIAIDNRTGEILAYVGSPDYFDEPNLGRNDGVQALRQPGSTLKPFLYQLALENRVIRPNTILADVPTYYAIPGAKIYHPTNYNEDTFLGPVLVRVALANSLNVPAVRVLEKVGVEGFLNRLHQLGFENLKESPEYYGLGLTLGSGEVSLWELARAYVVLAREGKIMPIRATIPNSLSSDCRASQGFFYSGQQAISFFLGRKRQRFSLPGGDIGNHLDGKASKQPKQSLNHLSFPLTTSEKAQLLPVSSIGKTQSILLDGDENFLVNRLLVNTENQVSECLTDTGEFPLIPTAKSGWRLIADILSDRHARAVEFGVNSVLNLPFQAAVKTGTSSDYRDTWTVGFTRDYTVATWVGNFNGDRLKQISGVMGAAPLWQRIMLRLHENREPDNFLPPEGMVLRSVCAISGWHPSSDCPAVVQEYFDGENLAEYESREDISELSNLPGEYRGWLARQSQPILGGDRVKILFPEDDDYFLIDAEGGEQRLEFKSAIATADESVEWWLNGEKLTAGSSSNSLFWQMMPGEWVLEVRSGGKSDRVSFQVQLLTPSGRGGFSIRLKD